MTGALGTSTATLLQNSASSNKVFKINTILVTNCNCMMVLIDILQKVSSTGATVVLIDKNSSLYLEEDKIIRGDASAAGDLEFIISYEEIS